MSESKKQDCLACIGFFGRHTCDGYAESAAAMAEMLKAKGACQKCGEYKAIIERQQAALDEVREFPCHHEAMNSCAYCHGEPESVPCQWRSEFLKVIAKADGGDL